MIIVVWKSYNCSRALNDSVTPCDLNHLIFVWSTPWTFNFLDDNRFRLLFWDWVSILINFFLLIIFTLSVFFIFCFFFSCCNWLWFSIGFPWGINLLLIIWITSFIHVINRENLIRMWICRPNTKISISTSSCKIFISKLAKINYLDNLDIMSSLYYIMLILFIKTKDHEVTFT